MTVILDAQLPPALAVWLRERGVDARAAGDLGLRDASDADIWSFAQELGAAILTKDEDFAIRRNASKDGPAIIWVRIGNTTNRALINRFAAAWPAVEELSTMGHGVIEIR
jgi:predicted nuclease of predicted toxin-antitoxin system